MTARVVALTLVAACTGGGSAARPGAEDAAAPAMIDAATPAIDAATIDAAIDAPAIDAAIDAPAIDASIDASIDAQPLDAAVDAPPGPVVCHGTTAPGWDGEATIGYEHESSANVVRAQQVHWRLLAVFDCEDVYVPDGIVSASYGDAFCHYLLSPGEAEIRSHGELRVDRSTTPATYRMNGALTWPAMSTCPTEPTAPAVSVLAGGPWAEEARGTVVDGALAGELQRDFHGVWWDFHRSDAIAPVADPCVGTPVERFTMTWQRGGASSTVTWTHVATAGCRDDYVPADGVATAPAPGGAGGCTSLTIAPLTGAVEPHDGSLSVFRSSYPPSFSVTGGAAWSATRRCYMGDAYVDHATSVTVDWGRLGGRVGAGGFSARAPVDGVDTRWTLTPAPP